jgi:hypothetical protein
MRLFQVDETVVVNNQKINTGARSTTAFSINGLTEEESCALPLTMSRDVVLAMADLCDADAPDGLREGEYVCKGGPEPQIADPSKQKMFFYLRRPETSPGAEGIKATLAAMMR